MAPKKAVAVAETSMSPTNVSEKELKSESTVASDEPSKAVKKVPAHPPAFDMVKEALKELDQRKGVSAQAVRAYIKEKYTSVDEVRVKSMVRKALGKGIESGVFVRPANSNTVTGAQGRFRLAVRKPKDAKPAKSKETKENADPNAGKAKDAKAGGSKKTKSATEGTKPKKVKTDAAASKVAPAKKPKAKRPAETEDVDPESKPKSQKTSKKAQGKESGKSPAKKGGKAAQKAEDADGEVTVPKKGGKKSEDAGQEVTAPKKGGRKAAQKAEDGEENAGATKAAGRKGKKAAEK